MADFFIGVHWWELRLECPGFLNVVPAMAEQEGEHGITGQNGDRSVGRADGSD